MGFNKHFPCFFFFLIFPNIKSYEGCSWNCQYSKSVLQLHITEHYKAVYRIWGTLLWKEIFSLVSIFPLGLPTLLPLMNIYYLCVTLSADARRSLLVHWLWSRTGQELWPKFLEFFLCSLLVDCIILVERSQSIWYTSKNSIGRQKRMSN